MRGVTVLVFEEVISGTSGTWYSSAQFNDILRDGDSFAVQACPTYVGGTSPTLTVQAEHSEDSEHWVATPSAEIVANILSGFSFGGYRDGYSPVLHSFLRFRITLGGTTPRCRLKLYVTVRSKMRGNKSRDGAVASKGRSGVS